jgi:glucosamine 6-phosphate synthetase-like amidotransferase/phosphosugar isomerase protein
MATLACLDYRGDDNTGIATVKDGAIHRRRAPGKLASLASKLGTVQERLILPPRTPAREGH